MKERITKRDREIDSKNGKKARKWKMIVIDEKGKKHHLTEHDREVDRKNLRKARKSRK